jgi:ATP cone domain.
MVFVIKRNGSKEEFSIEKIVVSCLKAGATLEKARKIAYIIQGRIYEKDLNEISAKELTKQILELLKRENEEWYKNWLLYDKAVKRRRTEEELKE